MFRARAETRSLLKHVPEHGAETWSLLKLVQSTRWDKELAEKCSEHGLRHGAR